MPASAPVSDIRYDVTWSSLGEFLERAEYSRELVEHHVMPMCAAIWLGGKTRSRTSASGWSSRRTRGPVPAVGMPGTLAVAHANFTRPGAVFAAGRVLDVSIDPAELEIALRVLAQVDELDTEHPDAVAVRRELLRNPGGREIPLAVPDEHAVAIAHGWAKVTGTLPRIWHRYFDSFDPSVFYVGTVGRGVWKVSLPDGNLSMQDMNPIGYQAVLGSDEHRSAIRDARRCDE